MHTDDQHQQTSWSMLLSLTVAAAAVIFCAWLIDIAALIYRLLQLFALILGLATAVCYVLSEGRRYTPLVKTKPIKLPFPDASQVSSVSLDAKRKQLRRTTLSNNMDALLKDITEYLIRDCVSPWYNNLARNKESFGELLHADAAAIFEKSSELLSEVDWLRFLAVDAMNIVAGHLAAIRIATVSDACAGVEQKLQLHPCACGGHAEDAFLRTVSEYVLLRLLPASYSTALRHVLQNIFATAVLKVAMDILCNPDTVNLSIVNFLSQHEAAAARIKQHYAYADSYEGFVKRIEKCSAIGDLQQFRYHILQELVHATAVQSLRFSSEKGDLSYSPPSGIQQKGELLKARNLKVYLNQLKVAKSICEKKIVAIGGAGYESYLTAESSDDRRLEQCTKLVPFNSFMQSMQSREAFLQYMRCHDNGSGDLAVLEFWLAIEALRTADASLRYQQASEIYKRYGRLVQDRSMLKALEAYLIGNSGPEAFFKVQETLAKQLEDRHYASFVVSDMYWSYISHASSQSAENVTEVKSAAVSAADSALGSPSVDLFPVGSSDDSSGMEYESDGRPGCMRSELLRHRLDDLNEKIFNKSQALQGLRATVRTDDPKYERVVLDLEKTLESLQLERHHLESHKKRDELWWRNIGKWRATVYSAEVVHDGDKAVPHFVVIVQPSEFAPYVAEHGWVISRTLDEFWVLHSRMTEVDPRLSKTEFPAKKPPKKSDDSYAEKTKNLLTAYLSRLLKDDRLKHSEPLCHFLSPTPAYLKDQLRVMPVVQTAAKAVPAGSGKLTRSAGSFTMPKLFKKVEEEDDDQLLFLDEEDTAKDVTGKSSMVQPLYALASEIFELHGVFKWFRRTLIHMVQVAYGKSINRQLQETVAWMVSEPVAVHYVRWFRDSMWPGGCSLNSKTVTVRTEEQKAQTRRDARELLLRNVPDILKNMFGEETAKRGAVKVFEALQDDRLNRHLAYLLLENLLRHLIPELLGAEVNDSHTKVEFLAGEPVCHAANLSTATGKTDSLSPSSVTADLHSAEGQRSMSSGGRLGMLMKWGPHR